MDVEKEEYEEDLKKYKNGRVILDSREARNFESMLNDFAEMPTGSDNIDIEKKLRFDKNEWNWKEPETRYRWDSESGREAVLKRWNKDEEK